MKKSFNYLNSILILLSLIIVYNSYAQYSLSSSRLQFVKSQILENIKQAKVLVNGCESIAKLRESEIDYQWMYSKMSNILRNKTLDEEYNHLILQRDTINGKLNTIGTSNSTVFPRVLLDRDPITNTVMFGYKDVREGKCFTNQAIINEETFNHNYKSEYKVPYVDTLNIEYIEYSMSSFKLDTNIIKETLYLSDYNFH